MENFYKPLASKVWDLMKAYQPTSAGVDEIAPIEELPLPEPLRTLVAQNIEETLLPKALQVIIGNELNDDQLNRRLKMVIELVKEGFTQSPEHPITREEIEKFEKLDENSAEFKLYSDVGNLIYQVIRAFPQFGLEWILELVPKVVTKGPQEAIGFYIVKNLGEARTVSLMRHLFQKVDLSGVAGPAPSDKEVAHSLTNLKTSVALLIVPAIMQRWARRSREITDFIIDSLSKLFGKTYFNKYAKKVRDYCGAVLWRLLQAVLSLLSVAGQPIASLLAWLLGKIYLDKRSLRDTKLIEFYLKTFAFQHIDQVVDRYHTAMKQMKSTPEE